MVRKYFKNKLVCCGNVTYVFIGKQIVSTDKNLNLLVCFDYGTVLNVLLW